MGALLTMLTAFLLWLAYPNVVLEPAAGDYLAVGGVVLAFALVGLQLVRASLRARRREASLIFTASVLQWIAVGAYAAVLYVFHWPAVVGDLGIGGWIVVPDVVGLLPYFVLVGVVFFEVWWGERKLEIHTFSARAYLLFEIRQYMLPLLPILTIVALADLLNYGSRAGIRWVAEISVLWTYYPIVQWLGLGVVLFLLYCMVPFVIRFLWRARPLPPGPVRRRLEEFAEAENVRSRDILVWPTGGQVMNAAVIGVAAPFRYVLITDALLDALPEEEVEAVFAHEAGHAKHKHMLLFFFYTVCAALLIYLLFLFVSPGPDASGLSGGMTIILLVGAILFWFGILFGFLSRRFEQQADVYGALAIGRVRGRQDDAPESHPFVRAMEGLAAQSGDIREVKGWRHFSISERIDFLVDFLSHESVRRSYRKRMRGLMAFFFCLLAILVLGASLTIPYRMRVWKYRADMHFSRWLLTHGHAAEGIALGMRTQSYARQSGLLSKPGEKANDELLRLIDLIDQNPNPEVEVSGDLSEWWVVTNPWGLERLVRFNRAVNLYKITPLYVHRGNLEAARIAISRAIREETRIGRPDPLSLVRLGKILAALNHPKGSRSAYRDALALARRFHDDKLAAEIQRLLASP